MGDSDGIWQRVDDLEPVEGALTSSANPSIPVQPKMMDLAPLDGAP